MYTEKLLKQIYENRSRLRLKNYWNSIQDDFKSFRPKTLTIVDNITKV